MNYHTHRHPILHLLFLMLVLLSMFALFTLASFGEAHADGLNRWRAHHIGSHHKCTVTQTSTNRYRAKCRDGYRHVFRPCAYEDSRNCMWDAGSFGVVGGHSFVDLHGHAYYLRRV